MAEVLTQIASVVPDCRVKPNPAPAITNFPAAAPEGFRAWLPALVILIGLPLLTLVTTKYVLLPSLQHPFAQVTLARESAADRGLAAGFLTKIPINVSGATDAHSGIKGLALVCANNAFKNIVDQNHAKLALLANNILGGKTISDLDQSSELEATRAQLMASFNHALGGSVVREVYISLWPSR